MAKKNQNPQPQSKVLSADDLMAGITKIDRRINDLSKFDVKTIAERFDSRTQALQVKLNSTLADIFGRDTPEYRDHSIRSLDTLPLIVGDRSHPINVVRDAYQKGINDSITKLTSLRETLNEKLEDIENDKLGQVEEDSNRKPPGNGEIFIVHGHDELAKENVARFISKLDLEPIILHEQPSGGKTIIEKLEAHILVDFAVVLLTPDDVGYPAGDEAQKKKRARQNVILELGLFLGVLGRKRVCALHKGDVEIPSDYQGVIFIPMDDAGAWKMLLAGEIKKAGINFDMNKVI